MKWLNDPVEYRHIVWLIVVVFALCLVAQTYNMQQDINKLYAGLTSVIKLLARGIHG